MPCICRSAAWHFTLCLICFGIFYILAHSETGCKDTINILNMQYSDNILCRYCYMASEIPASYLSIASCMSRLPSSIISSALSKAKVGYWFIGISASISQ